MTNRINNSHEFEPVEPIDPLLKLTEDPVFNAFFGAMKFGWQFYFVAHAQLLRHLAVSYPDMSEETRNALGARVAQAVVHTAKQQAPTAQKLYDEFRDICLPVLRALGISEEEISDLENSDDA